MTYFGKPSNANETTIWDGTKYISSSYINNSLTSSSDPTVLFDSNSGYLVGQQLTNTASNRLWICTNNTPGSASWRLIGGNSSVFKSDSGTVALWTFNGDGNDSSANGLNLTASGTPTYAYGFANRQVYRGTSGNNYSLTTSSLDLTGSMFFEMLCFAKPNPASAYVHTFMQYGPNATRRYFLDFDNTTAANFTVGFYNGTTTITASSTVLTEQWSHVCSVREVVTGSTTLSLYINGTLAAITASATVPSTGSSTLYISRNATGATTQPLFGEFVGGLHISSYIPSLAEIKQRVQLYHPNPSGYGA